MTTTSLTNVFRELFAAPMNAVTKTEEDYRRIWARWLEQKLALLTDKNGKLRKGVDLTKMLDNAPVVSLDGVIEVGITMRIASVSEFNAEVEAGLGIGPIHASGGFGFVNRSSQESIFQASTRYTISNFNRDLKKYLEDSKIPVTNPDEVKKAIEILKSPLTPKKAVTTD
jgi:hypothetical protein